MPASELREATRHRLRHNIFSLYALQGLNYLLPVLAFPFLIRKLGVETFGTVAFAQSLATYLTIFTDYGFNLSATRAVARCRHDHLAISSTFCRVFLIKAIFLLFAFLILGGFFLAMPRLHKNMEYILWSYLGAVGSSLFPLWYFQGVEKMRLISLLTGAGKLLSTALIFVCIRSSADGPKAVAIQSLGLLLAGMAGVCVALRDFNLEPRWPSLSDVKDTLHSGWHLFVSTASISLYTNTNVLLVALLAGNQEAGLFSAAERLLRALSGIIFPVIQALYPHTVSLVAESRESALRFLRKVIRIGVVVALCAGAGVLVFAAPLAEASVGVYAPKFIPLLRCLAPLPLLVCLSAVLGMLVLIPFGFERSQSRLQVLVGLTNLALGALMIPHLGAFGAILDMLLIEALLVAGNLAILSRGGVRTLCLN